MRPGGRVPTSNMNCGTNCWARGSQLETDTAACIPGGGGGGGGGGQYTVEVRSGIINPATHLDYFQLFGRLLGKAVLDSCLLDVPLCSTIYCALLNTDPCFEDLAEVDPAIHSSMEWIQDHDITVRLLPHCRHRACSPARRFDLLAFRLGRTD